MEAPESYLGIDIPPTLRPNWWSAEASWWRMGVRYGILGSAQLIRDEVARDSAYRPKFQAGQLEAADFLARKVES